MKRYIKSTTEELDLYAILMDAGCADDIDHHESDLYVRVTPTTKEIVTNYCKDTDSAMPKTFIDQIDNERWYDIPFMYTPYWEKKFNR